MATNAKDVKITELHQTALNHFSELEKIIDELKNLGDHSLNGSNALMNVREHLSQIAER